MGKQRIIHEITTSRWFIVELLLGVILAAYLIFLGPYTLALLRAAAGNPAPLELGIFWPAIAVPLCLGALAWWARCPGLAIGLALGAAIIVMLDFVLPDAAALIASSRPHEPVMLTNFVLMVRQRTCKVGGQHLARAR